MSIFHPLQTFRQCLLSPIADIGAWRQMLPMKNIQIIEGAANATFSVFQATDEEFGLIFPQDRDIEFVEDFIERVGQDTAGVVLAPLWKRPILKREAQGIHGTLFYEWEDRREHFPASKREVDLDERGINEAPRRLFRANR
jgi:hypothetical protein